MRTMHDTIEDRVGEGRIAQMLMPAIARKLTRDDRGPSAIAVVEDLQQVLALGVFEPDQSPIIEDQHIDARKARQHGRVRPVPLREREFGKEARNAPVDHALALTAGLLSQRAGEKRLADPGRAGDEDVLMLGDPAAGRQLPDHRPIQFPPAVVEIFQTRVAQSELGLLEPARERAILAGELLGIDEHAQALVETERGARGIALLVR